MKGTQMGFIAQELEKVFPSMVVTASNEEKSKAVKYNELFPVLVKAIQEQQQMIEKLKSDNESFMTELKEMKMQAGTKVQK